MLPGDDARFFKTNVMRNIILENKFSSKKDKDMHAVEQYNQGYMLGLYFQLQNGPEEKESYKIRQKKDKEGYFFDRGFNDGASDALNPLYKRRKSI